MSKQTVFLFPRGIRMQLSDALAQNYAMSFKAICKCSTMETRVLSIFADHATFLAEKIHIMERSKGRLSRDRPIMVSDQSPVLYVWTGQGRQAFEVHLSSEEYGRATCRSPEDVNTTLPVEPTPSPFVTLSEPEETKGVEVLDPEMVRCLLAFKKGLQSPRQVSVTVARCQEAIAAHDHLNVVSLYQQWFVNMMVAIQPHTSANIARVRIDHDRLEALLIRAGYAFNSQGYLIASGDPNLPAFEQLPPTIVQESQDQWVGTDVASRSPLLALLPEGCADPVGYLTDFFNQMLVK